MSQLNYILRLLFVIVQLVDLSYGAEFQCYSLLCSWYKTSCIQTRGGL